MGIARGGRGFAGGKAASRCPCAALVFLGGREAVLRRARRRLAAAPKPGTNTVLVAHVDLMRETTGIEPLEGEAGVFAPDGARGFKVVAHFTP